MDINWEDPRCKISKYFSVKDSCYLNSWGVLHKPSDQEKENILKMAIIMDKVRDSFNSPIVVSCWIRPILNNRKSKHHGQDYNLAIHGALHSAHKDGRAVDFVIYGENSDKIRQMILDRGLLEDLSIRLEDLPKANWIHLDCAWVEGKDHFFKP